MEPARPDDGLATILARAGGTAGVRFVGHDETARFLGYAELHTRAASTAGALQELGVARGDVVALVLPTAPAFYDAFFGVIQAGAIPVALYPPVRLRRMAEYQSQTAAMLRAAGARLVLTDASVRRVLGRTIAAALPALGCVAVEDLRPATPRATDVDPDAPAFLQFSSGATGEPKPVTLTHRQVLANVDALIDFFLAEQPEHGTFTHSGVSWLPLYHDMGLVGCVLTAARLGRDLTLLPPEAFIAAPALWLRAISRYRATISPAPNFAYSLALDRVTDEDLRGVDLSCWRFALNGAEPVSATVLERFVERFGRFGLRPEALTPVYGLAEATLAVTFSTPGARFTAREFDGERLLEGSAVPAAGGRRLVSVGRPLRGYAVRIVDDADEPLAEGRLGRVGVRGPSIMRGYWRAADETRAVLADDGWLDTGDIGFIHEGELFLFGRRKDIVIIRGRNHAPQVFEQAAERVAGVRKGCAVAAGLVPADGDGEALFLFAERDRRTTVADDVLVAQVRREVTEATAVVPHAVLLLPAGTLPRTSSGKLRRSETVRRYLTGTLTRPRGGDTLHAAAELVASRLAFTRVALGAITRHE